jgi:hypothetical protein
MGFKGCLSVNEIDVNIDIVICGSSAHYGTNALCSASTATNYATKIARADTYFKKYFVALAWTRGNCYRICIVNNAAHDMSEHCDSNRSL